jgi:hypothetical protein
VLTVTPGFFGTYLRGDCFVLITSILSPVKRDLSGRHIKIFSNILEWHEPKKKQLL